MIDQQFLERLLATPLGTIMGVAFLLMVATLFMQSISALRKGKNGNGHGVDKALEVALLELDRKQQTIDKLASMLDNYQAAMNNLRASVETGFQIQASTAQQAVTRHTENQRYILEINEKIPVLSKEVEQLRGRLIAFTSLIQGALAKIEAAIRTLQKVQVDTLGLRRADTSELPPTPQS